MVSFVSESERLALVSARAVAPLLGGTVDAGSPGETSRAWVNLACGLRLVFLRDYRGKGEILAYLIRPGYPGESRSCGKIGVDLSRDPVKLAKDIERRLLAPARDVAAAVRKEWADMESRRAELESLATEFAALPGVRTNLEKAGRGDQRLQINYYDSEKGTLSAEIYSCGSLYVKHIRPYGGADRLRALIAALAD